MSLGRLRGAMILTPSASTVWPASVSSLLPPVSPARSMITEPGAMFAIACLVIRIGAGRPGIWAVVMITFCFVAFSASASRTFSFSSSVRGRA